MSEYRKRRLATVFIAAVIVVAFGFWQDFSAQQNMPATDKTAVPSSEGQALASTELETIAVKGRAPKTDYSRAQFGDGWRKSGSCSTREIILARDLEQEAVQDCKVYSGTLQDPYTNKMIRFQRGAQTSDDVQIDHVVALSDAWQKGAQQLTPEQREEFANDPLELLAVEGKANQNKSDGDAATWLPPHKAYRCRYVARQVAVKKKYSLWVTAAEKSAIKNILANCPTQRLPLQQ